MIIESEGLAFDIRAVSRMLEAFDVPAVLLDGPRAVAVNGAARRRGWPPQDRAHELILARDPSSRVRLLVGEHGSTAEHRVADWGLPPRLEEIARLMLRGLTDKEIASATGLSHATVRTYATRLYRRLGAAGRMGLVALANQHPSPQHPTG